jgi:hypothetical protein
VLYSNKRAITTGEGTVVTLAELRRRAERAQWDYEGLDTDAEEAETEVFLARAEGDTELEQTRQERATRLRDAADRAYDRMESAEEALAEAEWALENPEEAAEAAEYEAAATARTKELIHRLLREGKIKQEFYELLIDVAARM